MNDKATLIHHLKDVEGHLDTSMTILKTEPILTSAQLAMGHIKKAWTVTTMLIRETAKDIKEQPNK